MKLPREFFKGLPKTIIDYFEELFRTKLEKEPNSEVTQIVTCYSKDKSFR